MEALRIVRRARAAAGYSVDRGRHVERQVCLLSGNNLFYDPKIICYNPEERIIYKDHYKRKKAG